MVVSTESINSEMPRFDERLAGLPYRHGWYIANIDSKYPLTHDAIDAKVAEALAGADQADADDARELAEWFKGQVNIELDVEYLTDMTQEEAREYLGGEKATGNAAKK